MINLVSIGTEEHASHRYRTEVICRALLMGGIQSRVTPTFDLEADVCVYGKHWRYGDYIDAVGAKSLGKRIVFDCCDDHTETGHAAHYARMMSLADQVTCNSRAMQALILEAYGKFAEVIEDPIIMAPLDREPDLTKLAWIGHHNNWPAMVEWFPQVEGMDLTVCVPYGMPVERLGTRVVPWNPVSGERVLGECGVLLVPYDDEPRRRIKSANRVLEGLNKSMVVVTNGIDSTQELMPFVETCVADVGPHSIKKMEQGREYARKFFSQEAIGKKWRKALCG